MLTRFLPFLNWLPEIGPRSLRADLIAGLDCRVDAEDMSVEVDQRSAAIAGVQRGICLDERLGEVRALRFRVCEDAGPASCAHDARADAGVQIEWGANGDDPLTNFERVRVAKLRDGQRNAFVGAASTPRRPEPLQRGLLPKPDTRHFDRSRPGGHSHS